jgi:hypothetical protein
MYAFVTFVVHSFVSSDQLQHVFVRAQTNKKAIQILAVTQSGNLNSTI